MHTTSWLRYSLAGMFCVFSLAAIGAAALAYASQLWASAFFSTALALLLFGGLLIVFRHGRARAFWIGFVMFGGVYLTLVFGPWLADNVGPHLLTTKLLEYVHRKLPPLDAPPESRNAARGVALADYNSDGWVDIYLDEGLPYPASYAPPANRRAAQRRPWDPVRRIGHSMLAILVALAGGAIGRALFDSQSREKEEPAQAAPQSPAGN